MLPDRRNLAETLVKKALSKGAEAAEIYIQEGHQHVVDLRLERVERLQSSGELGVGIRVFKDGASALTSTRDTSVESLDLAIDGALELVGVMEPDPYHGLVDAQFHPQGNMDLGLVDPTLVELPLDKKLDILRRTEAAGMGHDPRITNSSGAFWRDGHSCVTLANSNGFVGHYQKTMASFGVSLIAEAEGVKQTDGWYGSSTTLKGLEDPEAVGEKAGMRAARKLGARSIQTQRTTVVFDPSAGADLLKTLASSASAAAIHRGRSFLVDRLGTQVANAAITIVDDPTLKGGISSRPFDGEGVSSRRMPLIDKGQLVNYLSDGYYGRKLDRIPTGHGARSFSSAPAVAPTNLILEKGNLSEAQLLAEVGEGFYVTRLYWVGINPVTGDMSRGAEGIWIENGTLSHAVQEVTLAGNLIDMLSRVSLIADNQDWHSSIVSPSFAVPDIMISGK